jgi:hypothetical protein
MKTFFKFVVLLFAVPRFLPDMPLPSEGNYIAGARKYSPFYTHTPTEVPMQGLLRAYIAARWIAFKMDLRRHSNGVTIQWYCRKAS